VALTVDTPELLSRAIGSSLSDVYTTELGEIQKYDPATRTADVRVIVQRAVPTEEGGVVYEELPILPGIPVAFPRGGGTRMSWPLQKGDVALCSVLKSSISSWRETGQVPCKPVDTRGHHPAHAVYHAGASLVPDATSEPNTSVNGIILEATEIRLGANAAQYIALADDVKARLDALQVAHDTHKHATAGTGPPSIPDTIVGALAPVAATKAKAE
jgi:hypothetical protein